MGKTILIASIIVGIVILLLVSSQLVYAPGPPGNPGLQSFDAILQKLDQIIATIGIPASTQAQIDDVQNKINSGVFGLEEIKTEVTNLEDTQYIPFKIRGPSSTVMCAPGGGLGLDGLNLRIQSTTGKDFVVTSIIWNPTGVNEAIDIIVVNALVVDGFVTGFRAGDLTGTLFPLSGIDFTQIPSLHGVGNFPDQIALSGSIGSGIDKDLRILVVCNGGLSGGAINMDSNSVHVSGWKLKGDTITLTALKA